MVRKLAAGAQGTGALSVAATTNVSSSQLSEMQDRLDSLETQVEDERNRADALERQVDSERARADAMGRQVAGMGAMMEHVAAERGGSSAWLGDQFTSWHAAFAGWQQSFLGNLATTEQPSGADEVRPSLPARPQEEDEHGAAAPREQQLRPMAPVSGSPSGRAPRASRAAPPDGTPDSVGQSGAPSGNGADDGATPRGGLLPPLPPLPGTMP